jgi:oligo-alginate lyase
MSQKICCRVFALLLSIAIMEGCIVMPTPAPVRLSEMEIVLPDPLPWPVVACTPEELERLRSAYRGDGPEHQIVARRVKQAKKSLGTSIDFPPEGGQHNQWYQCDECQIGLETVDATHHRCPECDRVYSGYPYDNVLFSRRHGAITRDLENCAWAFALTGEKGYARRAREILIGYTERYSSYPYHSNVGKRTDEQSRSGGHVFEQTLNEATWMKQICEAYDLVRLSDLFSEADHQAIRDDLLLKVDANIAKHRAGKSNWQTYHNSAFLYIGGVLGRKDLVHRAILDPENGFYHQMDISVLPGGMWYENSWSYHFYTLEAMRRITETAHRLGIDLYSEPNTKDMYTVALDYQMADGTLPRFGDATTTGIPGGHYESAYHRWTEPQLLAVLQEGPTWDSILYGRTEQPNGAPAALSSELKRGPGHAILRITGPEGPASAVLAFGPFGGGHGHFDKLTFVYFGMGKELGSDPGRARSQAYRLPVHRNWYRATISHNGVLVDRASQEGVEGHCDLFLSAPALSAAAAHTDSAYPGVLHRRLLVLRPGFLVVADLLTAEDGREHQFDWLYHNRGEGVDSPQAHKEGEAPTGQGFEYIDGIRTGRSDGPIRTSFTSGEDRISVTLAAHPATDLLTGTGVGESVRDRVPLICVSRSGSKGLFAAAIDPTPQGSSEEVDAVEIAEDQAHGYLVHVRLNDGSEECYAFDPDATARTVEGMETRSKLLCLRREKGRNWEVLAEAED